MHYYAIIKTHDFSWALQRAEDPFERGGYPPEKWVSKTGKRKFAYPTKDEAWTNFEARKTRQIEILESQLVKAKRALAQERPE